MTATTWAKKLFAPKAARPARRPDTRTRLGMESFEDRLVPSATASLSNGVLSINCDNNSTGLWARPEVFGSLVCVQDTHTHQDIYSGSRRDIGRIVFNGGTGRYTNYDFQNDTNVSAEYHPGTGDGTIRGGGGTNSFYATAGGGAVMYGGSGNNRFFDAPGAISAFAAGTGDNTLYRATGTNVWVPAGVTPGPIHNIGLDATVYSHPYILNQPAPGGITAFLNGPGTILTVEGPTGGGFQLDGHWTDTRTPAGNGQFAHNFTSSGTVQLETGIVTNGNRLSVPLPGSASVTVTTAPNTNSDPVGDYNGLTFAGGLPLTADNSAATPFGSGGRGHAMALKKKGTGGTPRPRRTWASSSCVTSSAGTAAGCRAASRTPGARPAARASSTCSPMTATVY